MFIESVIHNWFDRLAKASDALGEGDRVDGIDPSSCPSEGDYCTPSKDGVIAHSSSSFHSVVEVASSFGLAKAVQPPSYAH